MVVVAWWVRIDLDWGESRGRKGRERERERGCSLRGIFAGEFFRGVDGRRYVTAVTEMSGSDKTLFNGCRSSPTIYDVFGLVSTKDGM
jgi:hypothetical protein